MIGRPATSHVPPMGARALAAAAALVLAAMLSAAPGAPSADAAVTTFGSSLSVPATLDTAYDLNYKGTEIPLSGPVFHIPHDGADAALWNTQIPGQNAAAPEAGQVVTVKLEGCARSNGPAPLTQIHLQSISPQPDGSVKVNLTSQAFEIPVCGQNGASGSTVSTYEPINLCVSAGDYVDFTDEGGFVPVPNGQLPPYPAGVPYMVLGANAGANTDAFVRNNGVGNGAMFSPNDTTNHDGFSVNSGEELMLQSTLATGPGAEPVCGGTKGVVPLHHHTFPPLTIPTPQLDGMNAYGVVRVAVYCHAATTCAGTITLSSKAHGRQPSGVIGSGRFAISPHSTGKAVVRVTQAARHMLGHLATGMGVNATLTPEGAAGSGAAVEASIAVHGA